MMTIVYVKIGDKTPTEIIEALETATCGVVMGYTLENNSIMGMRVYHDEPGDFEAVDNVESVCPQYDEYYEGYDDDQDDED